MHLVKSLSILFTYLKNQHLVSLIFSIVFFLSSLLISALIFMIFFPFTNFGFCFSSCFRFVVVQLPDRVRLFVTPWIASHQPSLSITNSQSLLKLVSIESVMPSNHLILCSPLLLLPSIFPSIRVFSNELAFHIRWAKSWSFSISSLKEYSGLISFKINWFDLPAF